MPTHSHRPETLKDSLVHPTFGFLISVVFTLVAFAIVWFDGLSKPLGLVALSILALFQLAVQFFFFFHLGDSRAKRLNTAMGALAAFSLLVIVIGSYWVMNHLRASMMTNTASGAKTPNKAMYMHDIPTPENELRP